MSVKVLITGASGNTGRAVANATLSIATKNNLQVGVAVRSVAKVSDSQLESFSLSHALQAAEFTSKGAEAVEIDFNDHAKSVAALKVCDHRKLYKGEDTHSINCSE